MQVANKIVLAGVATWSFIIISMDLIYGIPYEDPVTGSIFSVSAVALATRGFAIDEAGRSMVAMVPSICSGHTPDTNSHLQLLLWVE